MITFQDVQNNGHQAQATITKTDGVNGEKSLTGIIYFGQEVKDSIDKGWSLSFDGDDYVVVTYKKSDKDNTVSFTAVQAFFYKMSTTVFGETWNGSHTFVTYLNALFKGTDYNYINSATVDAFEKQNWGMKDKLSLFNDIIDQAEVEFYVDDKTIYIKPQIGTDLATVVRKGFNLADAEIQTDNSAFATYGRGFGAYSNPEDVTSSRLTVEYKSPLYDYYYPKFGAIEALPVADERYKITANLLAAVKVKVDNSWSVSLTLSLVDLQTAGYDYAMATAGDSITVIDDKLNFNKVVRIVKVVSDYNVDGNRVDTQVTCGSLSFADKQKTSQATLDNVAAGKTPLPNSWLTQQVQTATNDLLSARTELQFTDAGIVATDKSDANKVVLLNSSGLGVSVDGGQTFKTAITADAINGDMINIENINANNIVAGVITGKNLAINLNDGTVKFNKGYIQGPNGNIRFDLDEEYFRSRASVGGAGFEIHNGTMDFYGGFLSDWEGGNPAKHLGYLTYNMWGEDPTTGNGGIEIHGKTGVTLQADVPAGGKGMPEIIVGSGWTNDVHDITISPSIGGTVWIGVSGQINAHDKGMVTVGSGSTTETNIYQANLISPPDNGKTTLGGNVTVSGNLFVWGTFGALGAKNAVRVTRDGIRATPAYEMAEAYFGDMGESKTDDSMSVKVPIEDFFSDTVNTKVPYQVFLQSYSPAHVWVSSRDEAFFTVQSDQPNAPFTWEIKAKQRGYESDRLVKSDMTYKDYGKAFGYKPDDEDVTDEGSENNG